MINHIAVKCVFFNQPYLKKKLELNSIVTIKGNGIVINKRLMVIVYF